VAFACGVAACLAGARRRSVASARRSGLGARSKGICAVALRASKTGSKTADQRSLDDELDDEIQEDDLLRLFTEAGAGSDLVSFNQAVLLEGIDGILEEEATTLEELLVLWGDADTVDFNGFSSWYQEVVRLYDQFLWAGAVSPSDEVLGEGVEEEEEDEKDKDYSDDELFADLPSQGVSIAEIAGNAMPAKLAKVQPSRPNVEVTKLFRERCDTANMLLLKDAYEISEFADMIKNGEMSKEELKDMWQSLGEGDVIDILAFRELVAKIDVLFEYVEEGQESKAITISTEGGITQGTSGRSIPEVKAAIIRMCEDLLSSEKLAAGLDGVEEMDTPLLSLCIELEILWREQNPDLGEFETEKITGDWELLYLTSCRARRWGFIMNTGKFVQDGAFDGLVTSLAIDKSIVGIDQQLVDIDEIWTKNEKELAIRGSGSWKLGIQPNVVTGDDDLVLKLMINGVEYDKEDGTVAQTDSKILSSQMLRTYSYQFLSFVDDDMRVMRSSLAPIGFYVFTKMN